MSAAVHTGARAQPIYRCGTNGQTTYSQTPCPDGRPIDAADPRTAAQRAEAERAAAREKALAANLERERRRDEAAQRPATAAGSFKAPTVVAAASASPARKARYVRYLRKRAPHAAG